MSPTNWAVCPKCSNSAKLQLEEEKKKVEESYGKVSSQEYRKLEQERPKSVKLEPTLREDFDIGILVEGKFSVVYNARCDKCGLKHSFKHEEMIKNEKV